MHINVKVYGRQIVKVNCNKPEQVTSDNKDLVIEKFNYEENGRLNITVKANDIQGEQGNIVIRY
jgi:hypothetical protein